MMRTVSPEWPLAVRASYRRTVRVEVWRDGTELVHDLPVDGGQVTYDLGDVQGASASVSVSDPAYLPTDRDSALAPYGSVLRVYTGIDYAGGSSEELLVAELPITASPTWTERSSFEVTCASWLQWVADNRFLAPWSPDPALTVRQNIDALILDSAPWLTITHSGPDGAVPGGLVWEEDRLQAVTDLASMVGCLVRPVWDGSLIVAPEPVPDGSAGPVRSIDHGQDGVLLTGSRPKMDRDERYNGVVAYNPDNPAVWALATVDDPASPLVWGGPFGKKVLYLSSPILAVGNVQQAAQTRLDGLAGRARVIEASLVPDPSIEVGDHIRISWPPAVGTGTGVDDLAMVRTTTIPLGLDPMGLGLRGTAVTP